MTAAPAAAPVRELRDYLELQRELFIASMRLFGQDMAGAVNRRVLFLHEALKQTMLGWSNFGFFNYPNEGKGYSWPLAYPEYMAASGSMGVTELLKAPGISGLVTPHDYQARGIGGVYEPEGMADSCMLRGAYFYTEMDTRTWVRTKNEIGLAHNVREYAARQEDVRLVVVSRFRYRHYRYGCVAAPVSKFQRLPGLAWRGRRSMLSIPGRYGQNPAAPRGS